MHAHVWHADLPVTLALDVEEGGGIVKREEEDEEDDEGWPTEGRIEFQNVWMRYRDDLDHVLKGIDLTIEAHHKGIFFLTLSLSRLHHLPPLPSHLHRLPR